MRIFVLLFTLFIGGCSGSMPSNIGLKDGRLAPCPSSPNCVSSYEAPSNSHYSPAYNGTRSELLNVLKSFSNAKIISNTGNYIHVEFSSSVFGFVDDAEFVIVPSAAKIHFRSAARLGYSDLGVNKRRMNKIRRMILEQ